MEFPLILRPPPATRPPGTVRVRRKSLADKRRADDLVIPGDVAGPGIKTRPTAAARPKFRSRIRAHKPPPPPRPSYGRARRDVRRRVAARPRGWHAPASRDRKCRDAVARVLQPCPGRSTAMTRASAPQAPARGSPSCRADCRWRRGSRMIGATPGRCAPRSTRCRRAGARRAEFDEFAFTAERPAPRAAATPDQTASPAMRSAKRTSGIISDAAPLDFEFERRDPALEIVEPRD